MEVFVFPLAHAVFYPSISKPFKIFEPRYIQMVRDAMEQGRPIAIGHVDQAEAHHQFFAGEKLSFVREIAGFGTATIVDQKDDGSMTIFLAGQGKVKLGKVLDKKTPYIVCEAEIMTENMIVDSQSIQNLHLIHKMFIRWVEKNIQEPRHRAQFMDLVQAPSEIIGCFVSYLILDQDLQQMLLEEDDINKKISLIKALILSGETQVLPS